VREVRKFGFSLGLAMNIMGAVMFYRGKGHFIWFTGFGCLDLILAILWPQALSPLKKALDFIILLVGRIVNTVSLLLVFYLIFSPIGILLRIFGRDLLHKKMDRSLVSYWIKREKGMPLPNSYERMG